MLVVIKHVDTAAKPNGKRFSTITTEVEKPSREEAWKLVCDTQQKAAHMSTIALVNITVLDEHRTQVWSLN